MKLRDILSTDTDPLNVSSAKRKSVLRKALKKKRNNPIDAKTDRIADHIDVFGMVGSYGDDADSNPLADHRY